MTQKKKAFFSSASFIAASKALEQKTTDRVSGVEDPGLDLSEKVEILKQAEAEMDSDENEHELEHEPTLKPKLKTKKVKERNKERYKNTIDQYVPKKYIKDETTGSANVNLTLLTEARIFSVKASMTVGDLVGVALFKLLHENGHLKDGLLKELKF